MALKAGKHLKQCISWKWEQ